MILSKTSKPQLRHLPKMKLFIRCLLRKLWRCYDSLNYEKFIVEYRNFDKLTDEELELSLEDQRETELDIERFWIGKLKKPKFSTLAEIFLNTIIIMHSNVYAERSFSHVNLITIVSSIMKIKSFYQNEGDDYTFEPTEDHFICYKHWIK